MVSVNYEYAIREASVALAHLTTPEWGDTMARDPKGNRREHLERAALGFKYAMQYVEAELKRLAAAEFGPKREPVQYPCPNPGCVLDIRNHPGEACRNKHGDVIPSA